MEHYEAKPNNSSIKPTIIFGAGFYGKLALDQLGSDNVAFFIDNDSEKQGSFFHGKEIKSPHILPNLKNSYHVLIASLYQESMAQQLDEMGIKDYSLYLGDIHGFYDIPELILNPYEINSEALTEQEWSESEKLSYSRKEVFQAAEKLYNNQPLFNHIELETINRCNGSCTFCPVNHKDDPREQAIMSEDLFKNIISQLEEIQYAGRFSTFSNNEPLLDKRIIELNRYAREHLPTARMHLYTNGTLITLEKFIALTDILDELIIDNYRQDLKLIKPCEEIVNYCKDHPELKKKVTIVLRKPQEILTSRGGNAPNRKELLKYPKDRCLLPFKQVIVRPTGQISLCCNDALGEYTLGDLTKNRLLDIWYGPRFQMVRKCLYEGRENWGKCQYCDTFILG